jgi:transaldolase
MDRLSRLKIKIFADGADLDGMVEMYANPLISGFTTNPTLMRKAGVSDYLVFARAIVAAIPDRPISLEVFSDEFDEMEAQAQLLASLGPNVNVKIPITNTRGKSASELVGRLTAAGIRVNVTAIMTVDQVEDVAAELASAPESFVSVFAGRIADTGRDPLPILRAAIDIVAGTPAIKVIWASPREVLNIFQADDIGCHVITMTNDLLKRLSTIGKDLREYSLETVRMFHTDAAAAGYRLEVDRIGVRSRTKR